MTILVTGANGFIGSALCKELVHRNISVRGTVRSGSDIKLSRANYEILDVGDIGPNTDWSEALVGVQTVVHLAAKAHVIQENVVEPLAVFRTVNVEGTRKLAMASLGAEVKRFVFVSSIGVNGVETFSKPFNERDIPKPHSPYAQSKWEAEEVLRNLSKDVCMEVVIIRPPLVYGPGAPGNFDRMLRIVAKGLPLPLGYIHNKRSFVALENLLDLIVTCIGNPAAANQTFLAGDGEDVSTTELLRRMGNALDKPVRLIPLPVGLLTFLASLFGKKNMVQRLCGSLRVDISKAKELLGWDPPVSVEEGLRKAVEDFEGGL